MHSVGGIVTGFGRKATDERIEWSVDCVFCWSCLSVSKSLGYRYAKFWSL